MYPWVSIHFPKSQKEHLMFFVMVHPPSKKKKEKKKNEHCFVPYILCLPVLLVYDFFFCLSDVKGNYHDFSLLSS